MFLVASLIALLPAAGAESSITAQTTTADGQLLFVAMTSGVKPQTRFVCVWDLAKPELKAIVPDIPANVHTIRPTSDGKRFVLVTGTQWSMGSIEVWELATKKRLRTFDLAVNERFASVAVSPDGNWVALRPQAANTRLRVWNTETGRETEPFAKMADSTHESLSFSMDSKRLVVASQIKYAEFDLATGKKTKGWERTARPNAIIRGQNGWLAVLPQGKGGVLVTPTGNRRQSYIVRILTEKKDWLVDRLLDVALPPVISPDGQWLLISGGRSNEISTRVLKLNADGSPDMEGNPEKPAWRDWPLSEEKQTRRTLPGAMTFSSNSKRLFVGSSHGNLRVYNVEQRKQVATLFVGTPEKGELPDWHIITATGEFVASPREAESLAKTGKVKDTAKVRATLGLE